jgi:hypothetical protein
MIDDKDIALLRDILSCSDLVCFELLVVQDFEKLSAII